MENEIINLNQILRFRNGLYVAMSRVSSENHVFFVNEETRPKSFFSLQNNRGGAGVNMLEKNPSVKGKEKACQLEEATTELNYVCGIEKSFSITISISMILLNDKYIGKNKNNGFTIWRRNALLKQLGLKRRINFCQRNPNGLWKKPKYQYEEEPLPFFVYTSDYRYKSRNTKEISVFESLNPMKPGTPLSERNDANCYSTHRFLFEIDHHEKMSRRKLEECRAVDLALAKSLEDKRIVNRITFSGNKSYHCIIETSYEVPDYRAFWHWMDNKYFGRRADTNCAHPSCWTRTPGQKRPETGKTQRGYGNHIWVFDPTEELREMAQEREQKTETKTNNESESVPKNSEELFSQAVIKEREKRHKLSGESKMKTEANELLNGQFPTDGFIQWATIAINCLLGYGYSADELWRLLGKAGKDKKSRDRRDKVKGFVFNNRPFS